MINITLNPNYVLVEVPTEGKTSSGLYVNNTPDGSFPVLEVGKNCEEYKGKNIFVGTAQLEVREGSKKYLIVKKKDIFGYR